MIYHNLSHEFLIRYIDVRAAGYDTNEKLLPTGTPQPFEGDIKGFYLIFERPIGSTEWGEPEKFSGHCEYGGEVEAILKNENATPKYFEQADIIELEKSFMNFKGLGEKTSVKDFVEFVDKKIEETREENAYEGIDTNNNL